MDNKNGHSSAGLSRCVLFLEDYELIMPSLQKPLIFKEGEFVMVEYDEFTYEPMIVRDDVYFYLDELIESGSGIRVFVEEK